MKIKKLHIKNFKSIADLEIIEPNPFTVFVGPNGSGKSNIFEALEFFVSPIYSDDKARFFGGKESISNRLNIEKESSIVIESDNFNYDDSTSFYNKPSNKPFRFLTDLGSEIDSLDPYALQDFLYSFKRLFIKNKEKQKFNFSDNSSLSFSGDNLEKVLKRLLDDKYKNEEITELLSLFLPGFEKVDVISSGLSGTDTLLIYEKGIEKPFTKELVSDGTYNILVLITAILQSKDPQFLCIEEPENGLNPKVVRELVHFCRNACEEKGHYIWLNTHSQSLLSELNEEELIIVDKKKGKTQIKQFKKGDFYGLRADEALLSNVLGGGIPW